MSTKATLIELRHVSKRFSAPDKSDIVVLKDIDFTDLDNFGDGFPHHLFEIHRREAPVYWHEEPNGPGFWAGN